MYTLFGLFGMLVGLAGLPFLILYPPLGIILIVVGLLIFAATFSIKRRRDDQRWRDHMLRRRR